MADPLRLGIVGCGNHMYEFLASCLKWAPPNVITAACDVDPARLARFTGFYATGKGYTDVRDMLGQERLDAVIVAAGHAANFDICRAALEAGVNVFVEKTPVASSAEARALAQVQARSGKALMVGFNRRFMTAYMLAKEITTRPEFGPVRMYNSQFHANPYRSDAHYKLNHIIHHLDLARFLMGEIALTHVDKVFLDDRRVGYSISFKSPEGGIGVIQSASLLDELYPMERLELLGDRRNIVVENIKSLVYNRPPKSRKETFGRFALEEGGDALVWNPSHGHYPRFSHHGYENELNYFLGCVRDGKTPEPGIDDSLRTMLLLDDLERLTG
jgi:predicted dehydrogenase